MSDVPIRDDQDDLEKKGADHKQDFQIVQAGHPVTSRSEGES
jgi:hypothetical protein